MRLQKNLAVFRGPPDRSLIKHFMVKVGIQGERGSACDAVAEQLIDDPDAELAYLSNAENVLSNLKAGKIDLAVLAFESPLGTPVPETLDAIEKFGEVEELKQLQSEVRHVVLARLEVEPKEIKFVASHRIPLNKHKVALTKYFPGYSEIQTEDTGLAAQELAKGTLPTNTAVIAMQHAAKTFGLKVIDLDLPANDNYLTRFALVR